MDNKEKVINPRTPEKVHHDISYMLQTGVNYVDALVEYARKNGHVKFKDGARNREIVLNTAHWEELDAESAMTHSLF